MNTSQTYTSLFDFRIFHGYYLDKYEEELTTMLSRFEDLTNDSEKAARIEEQPYDIHQSLSIHPTIDSAEQIRNYKMFFRRNPLGFFLGTKVNNEAEMFIPIEQKMTLTFEVFLKNQEFLNFSDIELEGHSSQVYYFSNRSSQGGSGSNIGVGNFNLLAWHPNGRLPLHGEKLIYLFDPKAGISSARFTVSDAFSQEVLLQRSAQAPAGENLERYGLNLSALHNGLYELKIEEPASGMIVETIEFYKYVSPSFQRPFAIVELELTPGSMPFFGSGGQLKSPRLNLYINNRQSIWRYYNGLAPCP